jgi:hypothetical protein
MDSAMRHREIEPERLCRRARGKHAMSGRIRKSAMNLATILALASQAGCVPSSIIGPLAHEAEERDRLLARAQRAGMSLDLVEKIAPPLTDEERVLADEQTSSCRSSYVRKDALTWTGGGLIIVAAGITVGGAYATGNNDTTGKVVFGVGAGTLATLGGVLVAIGGIVQQRFTDRGCVPKITAK